MEVVCVWHRCGQAARVSSPWAAHCTWLLASLPGRAGTVLWAPVCHLQSSDLPGVAWSWAGTAPLVSPQQQGPAWGTVGKGGVVPLPLRSCWLRSSHKQQHLR